ncbi:MAG TPA: YIP1 family protein [Thermoanaerobaculia bacterium]|nr:YIP1 family protein [Thermoanaerobaculia bacterium]
MHESAFGRLVSVLIAPAKTFRSIAERPTWLAPMVVLVLLTGTISMLMMQRADMGEMIRTRVEESGRNVPAEAVERQVEFVERFGWLLGIVGALLAPVMYIIAAAVLLAIFKMLGSEITFPQSLSTFLYSLAPWMIAAVLTLPVVLARDSLTTEELQSGSLLMSNLSFLAPEDSGAAVRAALASVDLFSLWTLALLAIGYRIVARVSTAAAAGTVVALWLVWALGKVGWVAAFS